MLGNDILKSAVAGAVEYGVVDYGAVDGRVRVGATQGVFKVVAVDLLECKGESATQVEQSTNQPPCQGIQRYDSGNCSLINCGFASLISVRLCSWILVC